MNNRDTDAVFVHSPDTMISYACSRRQNDKNRGRATVEGVKNRVHGYKTTTPLETLNPKPYSVISSNVISSTLHAETYSMQYKDRQIPENQKARK
jgi:hypothetical protein